MQEFADAARRLHLIQGPLYVSGGDDPEPAGGARSSTATCRSCCRASPPAPAADHGEHGPGASRPLRSTPSCPQRGQPRERHRRPDARPHHRPRHGGRLRRSPAGPCSAASATSQFEDLTILLGYGDDTLHRREHARRHHDHQRRARGRRPHRPHDRRSHARHRRPGEPGDAAARQHRQRHIHIGTASGLLDLLAALLVLEGGVGSDVANLNDSSTRTTTSAGSRRTPSPGSTWPPRTGLDELGRPLDRLYSVTPRGAHFTIMLSQVQGGVATGIGAVTFAAGATAESVRSALQSLLFPQTAGADPGVSMTCGEREPHPVRGERLRLARRRHVPHRLPRRGERRHRAPDHDPAGGTRRNGDGCRDRRVEHRRHPLPRASRR